MSGESTVDVDDLPWTTAPEHAETAMRELGIGEGSGLWTQIHGFAVTYGLEDGLEDHSPSPASLAAGAVYLGCRLHNQPRCQHTVAAAVGVSTVAIRNSYQAILEAEGFDIRVTSGPQSWTDGGERER